MEKLSRSYACWNIDPDDVEIFFSELDYQVVEGERAFEVVVTKMGFLQSPLFLTLTPLTFQEFQQARYPLPNEAVFNELNIIDPAECKSLCPPVPCSLNVSCGLCPLPYRRSKRQERFRQYNTYRCRTSWWWGCGSASSYPNHRRSNQRGKRGVFTRSEG